MTGQVLGRAGTLRCCRPRCWRPLAPAPGQTIVDATVGAGGHARLLAERLGPSRPAHRAGPRPGHARPGPASAAERAARSRWCRPTSTGCARCSTSWAWQRCDGVLATWAFARTSSMPPDRGFSFQQAGPLDMRLDPEEGEPAGALLRRLSERDLADLFWTVWRGALQPADCPEDRRDAPAGAAGNDRATGRPGAALCAPAQRTAAGHRSGDAGLPGPADRGQRRAGGAGPVAGRRCRGA